MAFDLILPAFIAGVFTFLAPCTLPLVPAYLGFISGVSMTSADNPIRIRRTILLNGLFYVLGFSVVFISLGVLVGLGGAFLVPYRDVLSRFGGVSIFLFGLFMTGLLKFPALQSDRRFHVANVFKPGRLTSSFMFGATFALGWTPCIGPVLASVLILAATTSTAGQGALLLAVFSLGLAIPFLGVAFAAQWAAAHIQAFSRTLQWLSVIGGIFLMVLGVLLFVGRVDLFTATFFRAFGFLNFEARLLKYL